MTKIRRGISTGLLAIASAGVLPGAVEASRESCYDKVLRDCAEAMEDSNYIQRFALGVICSGMLAGCSTELL